MSNAMARIYSLSSQERVRRWQLYFEQSPLCGTQLAYKFTKNKTQKISPTFLIQKKTTDIKYYISTSIISDQVSHNILIYRKKKYRLNDHIVAQ